MNRNEKLKENLDNFIEMLGLEKEKQGEIVVKDEETYYHYLGSEYGELEETDEHNYKLYELPKHISYFSSHDSHKTSDGINPPLDYKENLYGITVSIWEETDKK